MLNAAWARFRLEWPVWLTALFVFALPFRRNSEITITLMALFLPVLLRRPEYRAQIRPVAKFLIPVFLCFWIPMLLSSFDSYNVEKSWAQSLAAIRFPLAALSIALLLSKNELRMRLLQLIAVILLFWAIDGYVQLIFGRDLLGIPMHEDRLNALFYRRIQFYGPTLAFLSPLLLEYVRRQWAGWAFFACLALIMGAVLIAGMRAGWLAIGMVVIIYSLFMLKQNSTARRHWAILIPALAVVVALASYVGSDKVRERVSSSLQLTHATESSLDIAMSYRVPIFINSLRMYQNHPVNGVGVRAFPVAYLKFADPDDSFLRDSIGAHAGRHAGTHAHNVVLEVMADTGTIGLIFWIFGTVLVINQWRRTPPSLRREAFPYVFALAVILFPLNSHFSIFGVYTSSLIWWLFGLWGATLISRE